MLNHIVIMGRLTRDPELRRTGSGIAVANFTVAVDRDFKGQDGGKETDFLDCVAWRQTGEFVSKYFKKGSRPAVPGGFPMSIQVVECLDDVVPQPPRMILGTIVCGGVVMQAIGMEGDVDLLNTAGVQADPHIDVTAAGLLRKFNSHGYASCQASSA